MKKKVLILGSTGSIGESALKVIRDHSDKLEIAGLAAQKNWQSLSKQAKEFNIKNLCLFDKSNEANLVKSSGKDVKIYCGSEGLSEISSSLNYDILLIAIVGTEGLKPCLEALKENKNLKTLAIASKEILVMAGEIITKLANEKSIKIIPVDSEHNAIFQCLAGNSTKSNNAEISKLILTASGGPFRKFTTKQIENVTPEQALKHPTWDMGKKISIDSATMFNKGLEMIEAMHLFDVPMAKIDVIIHPQSIIHSMVEFIDGSVIAQLSTTDMCFPIQFALTYPDRCKSSLEPLNFYELKELNFEKPNPIFPALRLARLAGESGGTLPTVFNAVNEICVANFLANKIKFKQIWQIVQKVMEQHQNILNPNLEEILAQDKWARQQAKKHST